MPQDPSLPSTVKRVLKQFMAAKNKNGKTIYVPKDTDLFLVHEYPDDYNYLEANPELQEALIESVTEGSTVTKAAKDLGMPISVVLWFSRCNEDFHDALIEARKFRAEVYHDRLALIADEVDETTSKSSKVKADVFKHLMEVGDRDRFGTQKKIIGDPNAPVSFIVDTGIRRLPEEAAVPTEGRTLGESEDQGRPESDNDEDQHGLPAPLPPAPDPLPAEEVLSPCLPPPIR